MKLWTRQTLPSQAVYAVCGGVSFHIGQLYIRVMSIMQLCRIWGQSLTFSPARVPVLKNSSRVPGSCLILVHSLDCYVLNTVTLMTGFGLHRVYVDVKVSGVFEPPQQGPCKLIGSMSWCVSDPHTLEPNAPPVEVGNEAKKGRVTIVDFR